MVMVKIYYFSGLGTFLAALSYCEVVWVQNLELSLILQDVHYLSDRFEFVSYNHIYRERNSKADLLAKAGGNLHEGFWNILEQNEAASTENFQVF